MAENFWLANTRFYREPKANTTETDGEKVEKPRISVYKITQSVMEKFFKNPIKESQKVQNEGGAEGPSNEKNENLLETMIVDNRTRCWKCTKLFAQYKYYVEMHKQKLDGNDKRCCVCRQDFDNLNDLIQHFAQFTWQKRCCSCIFFGKKETSFGTDKQFYDHIPRCFNNNNKNK